MYVDSALVIKYFLLTSHRTTGRRQSWPHVLN